MTDSGGTGWRQLPALDGVRALAVVAVVFFHYWDETFTGGFIGVDVFFVMSGFLITGIIGAEFSGSGRIDLAAFWGRRIRRLLPAVLVLVAVTSLVLAALGAGSSRQLADSIGALTWTTNLIEAFMGGTRAWLVRPFTTLDHLWSLAIEEQFYLVWPPVALVLLRFVRSRAARLAILSAAIAASAALMGFVGGVHAYFRPDTRCFELLAGAALAMTSWSTTRVLNPRATSVLALVAVAGLTIFVALGSPLDEWMYPWGFLFVTACAVALVASAVRPPDWLAAALGWGPIAHLGRVSYGVYLWHIPVLRILTEGRLGIGGVPLRIVQFAVLALVVEVSYRYVEAPFRTRRLRLGPARVAAGYAVACVALVLMVPGTFHDLDHRWDTLEPVPSVAAGQTRVMVVGDILGSTVASGLRADPALAVWAVTDPGCPFVSDESTREPDLFDGGRVREIDEVCLHWRDRWANAVRRFHPDAVVIAAGYWDTLEARIGGRRLDDRELQDLYRRTVRAQLDHLGPGGSGLDPRVVVVRIEDWSNMIDVRRRPRDEWLGSVETFNAALAGAPNGRAGVSVVELGGAPEWASIPSLARELVAPRLVGR